MANKKSEQLVARVGFAAPGRVHVRKGQLVDATDPVVKGRRDLFVTPAEYVEQATANPGDLRINKRHKPAGPGKARDRAAAEAAKADEEADADEPVEA